MDKILELMLKRIEQLEARVNELESRPVVEVDDRPATTKLLQYLKDNQTKEKNEELNR